jgi:hypothetical protein
VKHQSPDETASRKPTEVYQVGPCPDRCRKWSQVDDYLIINEKQFFSFEDHRLMESIHIIVPYWNVNDKFYIYESHLK